MFQNTKSQNTDSAKNNFNGGNSKMNYENLYKDLKSFFSEYIYADETEIAFLVLYSTATHFYEHYQTFPLLHISGDFATGKNRRLEMLNCICLNPTILTNPSLSSLFRSIDEGRGTILVDEADYIVRDAEIENFLLAGYQKGVFITRSVRDNSHEKGFRVEKFEVYSPKVLVTREGIESDPLNSRSITIITFPKTLVSDVPDILTAKAFLKGEALKSKVETMVSKQGVLESGDINLELRGRDAEIFDCLKDVANLYGDEAVENLKQFLEQVYVPESKYNTMLSFQEDLIRVLEETWESGDKAHLTFLKAKLEVLSNDHRNTPIKRIARAIRSLKFQLGRDSKGHFVMPNSTLLKVWTERYLRSDSNDGVQSSVEGNSSQSVLKVEKPARKRPSRSRFEDRLDTLLKRLRRRK